MIRRIIGTVALALAVVSVPVLASPAEAATGSTTSARAVSKSVTVTYKTSTPKWVRAQGEQQGQRPGAGTTQSITSDWNWWPPGWTVDFNRSETSRMAFAFGTCLTIVGPFWPAPWAIAMYAACGAAAFMAGWATLDGKCLRGFVPVQGWPVSLSKVRC